MNIQQLKLLAETLHGLLQGRNVPIGHQKSLDLIASLPGLRGWNQVRALPDAVHACELKSKSGKRLSDRLKRDFGLSIDTEELLTWLQLALVTAPRSYLTEVKSAIASSLKDYLGIVVDHGHVHGVLASFLGYEEQGQLAEIDGILNGFPPPVSPCFVLQPQLALEAVEKLLKIPHNDFGRFGAVALIVKNALEQIAPGRVFEDDGKFTVWYEKNHIAAAL